MVEQLQMNAISNPAEGLFGSNGTGIKTMYQFNGTAWENFIRLLI